ncbi:hypothetical protein AHMF7605_08355 [Adhaeribacter arboris]|uniref:Uncharacterized protein n=1 Tax=Adhaeribacter arboris TaxID=2072846 RepID=A0A2T2YDE5_9BACT|nr:hypothetical protein [Adhaeribacter arboris]PSR53535.1 hypothetical protein AHMF7605_08355 [Adhaeribacter arboris]
MNSTRKQMVPTKQLFILLLLLCLLLQAGYKALHNSAAPAKVPKSLAKVWRTGQFPLTEFWEYQGKFPGKAFTAFQFKPDGECEFYQVTVNDSHGYRLETLVYQKGTVQFHHNHTFTFYPTEGNLREFYHFCDNTIQNYSQKISPKDLITQTYNYSIEPNAKGQDELVIRGELADGNSTTFQAFAW